IRTLVDADAVAPPDAAEADATEKRPRAAGPLPEPAPERPRAPRPLTVSEPPEVPAAEPAPEGPPTPEASAPDHRDERPALERPLTPPAPPVPPVGEASAPDHRDERHALERPLTPPAPPAAEAAPERLTPDRPLTAPADADASCGRSPAAEPSTRAQAPEPASARPSAPGALGTDAAAGAPPLPAARISRKAGVIAAALSLLAGGAVLYIAADDDAPAAEAAPEGGSGAENGDANRDTPGTLPADPISAALAWESAAPAPAPEGSSRPAVARGVWFTGDDLVRAMPGGLFSRDLATGAENWTVPLEPGGLCGASPAASRDRVALLHGPACARLTVVDIAAGAEVMTTPLDSLWPANENASLAILGDTVAIGTGAGSMGFRVGDGTKLWESNTTDRCRDTDYTVLDGTFVSRQSCGFGRDGGSVRATDESGAELWEWEFGPAHAGRPFQVDAVISAEPLVVAATVREEDGSSAPRVLVVSEDHASVARELDLNAAPYLGPCRRDAFHDCWPAVVHDGLLYLSTNLPPEAPGAVPGETPGGGNRVVALDLGTGRPRFEVPAEGGGRILPFAVQDGRVLAYEPASGQVEGLVVAIDPATGQAGRAMFLDPSARAREAALMNGPAIHDQRPLWHGPSRTLVLAGLAFPPGEGRDRPALLVYR
ncbi:PQQ-binding-like beta-propeller repeat protein, partial [Streptomyces sp. DSM 44917]